MRRAFLLTGPAVVSICIVKNLFSQAGIFPSVFMTNAENENEGLRAEDQNLIVDTIFDVALDPSRYETLLDLWEDRIAPLRGREGDAGDEFSNAILEGHAARAGQVLDREPLAPLSDPIGHLMTSLLPTAALAINRQGVIAHANAAAKAVFSISAGQNVKQLPFDALQTSEMAQAVLEIVSGKIDERYIRCVRNETGRLVVFRLSLMEPAKYGTGLLLAVSTELVWPETLTDTIRDAFQLTTAEIEVVRALVEGWSVNEIAAARSRSVETVRTQVRSILSKTETRTQSELIRIALNLMDVIGGERRANGLKLAGGDVQKLKPLPFQQIWRPDGRNVDYVVLGDPNGRAILYLPGNYGLIRWPASAEALLEASGIRIVVPLKPGYGASSPVSPHADLGQLVAGDLAALMDKLDIARAPLIAQGLDVYFGYMFDRIHPGRLSAIITCGPAFPVLSKAQFDRMGKWHRFIRANARYAPKLLPFLVKAGFSLSKRIGKRGFLQSVYGNSPGDVATYEDPEVFEALITGSEVVNSEEHSAHRAFTNEAILTNRDWRELVHECDLPKVAFVGHEDPSIPVETVRELQVEFPDMVFVEDGNAGELILFKRWREVLDCALTNLEK